MVNCHRLAFFPILFEVNTLQQLFYWRQNRVRDQKFSYEKVRNGLVPSCDELPAGAVLVVFGVATLSTQRVTASHH